MKYFVYILECNDTTLYTGWTTNIDKRIVAHNGQKNGAKYTSTRRPVKIVYTEECVGKKEAMKREYAIKQLTKKQKILLINGNNHTIDL
ncbi:GIY-YIG nuclease family protein [Arenimonas sp.]|nr:GIY-YIG nuclease family protein [Candidatus Parcubacteria bacterium]